MDYVIAYDLGTGGCKASLYDNKGKCVCDTFIACKTYYPCENQHEQKPNDWWKAVVKSTKELKIKSGIQEEEIKGIGISGHSLGCVPLDTEGQEVLSFTPIWSDSRPTKLETDNFFEQISQDKWYEKTGNGFPPELYTVFKILWYKNNQPEDFERFDKILGTKDYINYRLTNVIATDYSYASGTGVYDLIKNEYCDELIAISGLDKSWFPDIFNSDDVIGTLSAKAAKELGLTTSVQVVAGGVDNSCMALGAKCHKEGSVYASLGSSAWVAVSSHKPVIDHKIKPFVFSHVIKGRYVSATAIFSSGSTLRWFIENILQKELTEPGLWEALFYRVGKVPVGANGVIFNPSLAGGSSLDEHQEIRGAFLGLDLSHKTNDMLRATVEGITLGLGKAYKELKKLVKLNDEILLVGGGSKSGVARQMYADIFEADMLKTSIDQQAAAFGAAALAGVGIGLYTSYNIIDEMHILEDVKKPLIENVENYTRVWGRYEAALKLLSEYSQI